MEQHELIEVGMYCHTLLLDSSFKRLVSLCEAELSLSMLRADTIEDREKAHRTYMGLKELLDLMQQFTVAKDQIVANNEKEGQ